MSLEELEVSRKRTLITSGVLFSLTGVFFLLGSAEQGWAFFLGSLFVLFARFLIGNLPQTHPTLLFADSGILGGAEDRPRSLSW
jgi:hypothetical protein